VLDEVVFGFVLAKNDWPKVYFFVLFKIDGLIRLNLTEEFDRLVGRRADGQSFGVLLGVALASAADESVRILSVVVAASVAQVQWLPKSTDQHFDHVVYENPRPDYEAGRRVL
jgi:hypothetical protein